MVLGGVADALIEALSVSRGAEGMGPARAADACAAALKALEQTAPPHDAELAILH